MAGYCFNDLAIQGENRENVDSQHDQSSNVLKCRENLNGRLRKRVLDTVKEFCYNIFVIIYFGRILSLIFYSIFDCYMGFGRDLCMYFPR